MRILHLRFKNINSLAGVWEIDFTHPDYVSSGIFAITGPTGAGKTTILDAICLALFGQTPRLARITQSENEIMSRQTGECYAEVSFETVKGRFRCHWSQHRSRKQSGGQLQSPKHEIAEAESGIILESKLKAVAGKVEEVTGMDFDRFTRSMLLAQGSFAAFLQARPDERAPILEQITGTAIYSRISIKVHERTSAERAQLAALRTELDGIHLLSPEEVAALRTESMELQQTEHTLSTTARIIRDAKTWRERIALLERDHLQLGLDQSAFNIRKEAAKPDLEVLEVAHRALKLSGPHAHIVVLRKQQEDEQCELVSASNRRPPLQLLWQTAFDDLEKADLMLTRAREDQTREAELIRTTRTLDVKRGETQVHLQGIFAEIENTQNKNNSYCTALTTYDLRMAESEKVLLGVAAFLSEHQLDAGLTETLTGIEQQLKGLKNVDIHYRDSQTKLAQNVMQIQSASDIHRESEAAWQTVQLTFTEAEQRLAEARVAGEAVLQGRTLPALRTEIETLTARHNRLALVQETVLRHETGIIQRAEMMLKIEVLEQKRQELEQREKILTNECSLREQVTLQVQENIILLNRVRTLEDDRRQLVDGAPCPLCGSSEHPYATGSVPQLDKAQSALEVALSEEKQARGAVSQISLERVVTVKDLQQLVLAHAELQKQQLLDEQLCADTFVELEITANGELWSVIIERESDICNGKLTYLRSSILEAERKEQDVLKAHAVLANLKDERALLDNKRLAARLNSEAAVAEHIQLEGRCSDLRVSRDRVLTEVKSAVISYGVTDVVPDTVDELLIYLTGRRNRYVDQLLAREREDKVKSEYAAKAAQQKALSAEAEKIIAEKELKVRELTAQLDDLVEQRLEQYGERNPDEEEKRLNGLLRQAEEHRESVSQELHRLQGELGGLLQLIDKLTQSVTQRGVLLTELETSFRLRLEEAGFINESSFIVACIPQERFDTLFSMADALRADETALQTRYQDCTQALESERDKNLTNETLEQIVVEYDSLIGQLNELQKAMGAAEHKLQQYTEQQVRHLSRLQAIAVQKRECERWEQLHSLIGSGDGKKFRNFAQGLTFELMVAHANRQLQNMSDRYILVRDHQEPLELNVIDNYQAGEIRSTKNLSGGESFIASLALSLGLSSMASRTVRVDSLFLDEGFGTLDEDALETALETLSGLQQNGKLIGIISHVPALKERIGTQIQVEVGSSGRSTLSGPGCRRVVSQ